ncbi:MAG: beta-galactosidase [Phycisphaerales bacterium]|nr:beta-galactosidase [Phycisphaerales bacterium]
MTSQLSHRRPTNLDFFWYGVPYYPEHWSEEDRRDDPQRMAAAGINVVRMAEFAWTRMEPSQGVFDFSLFDQTIDRLAEHGIRTILCTPTATPPRWLTARHPEILRMDNLGRVMSHGSRQHASHMSEIYRTHSVRITRAMAEHYRDHPAVIAWQTDNEFHCHFNEDHNASTQVAFRRWLAERYDQDIRKLNAAWGNEFWSLTYDNFEQVDTPKSHAPGRYNPTHRRDYTQFLSDAVTLFQQEQIQVLRAVNPRWRIFHNGTFSNIDYRGQFTRDLDFLGYDCYPMFHKQGLSRPWIQANKLDKTRGYSGHFIVPEQQSGGGGQSGDGVDESYLHDSPEPGEMRQMAYRSIARGADGLLFFRWRSCRFGVEQYWQGLLDHDNRGRRRYDEASKLGAELKQLGPELLGTTVKIDAAVAGPDFLVHESHRSCTLGLPAPDTVGEWVHRELTQRGVSIGWVHPTDDLAGVKLYIVPHWAWFDPAYVAPLEAWVKAGGTLVIGAWTATRDANNHISDQTPPTCLADLCGVEVDDYSRINNIAERPRQLQFEGMVEPMAANHWAEALKLRAGTKVLATWQSGTFAGKPAATIRPVGKGQVIYIGTWLSESLLATVSPLLMQWSGLSKTWPDSPQGVEVVVREASGRCLWFFFNNTQAPVTFASLPKGERLLDFAADPSTLPAYGVGLIKA